MSRAPTPWPRDLLEPWQKAQAGMCGCKGSDDMCRCQNEHMPWPKTIALRGKALETLRDTEECLSEMAVDQHPESQCVAVLKRLRLLIEDGFQ